MFDYEPSIYSKCKFRSGILIGYQIDGSPYFINEDALSGHLSITGKTGTGKSSYLRFLIKNMDRVDGNMVIIDPHGTLMDSVYASEREIIYIGTDSVRYGNDDIRIMMNVLDQDADPDMTAGWIRSIFSSSSFSNNTWGPRLDVMFRSVLSEFIKNTETPTLSKFFSIMATPVKTRSFVSELRDGPVKDLISGFISDRSYWREYSASTLNKILPIISSDRIYPLVSSERSLDLYSIMSEPGKLVFVDVSKGKIPPDASSQVSYLMLMKIWFDSIKRYEAGKIVNTYIFVDEAQNIPAGILETILSEGRKYGMRLVLSNQYMDQAASYQAALFGNVRNYISFQVSPADAALLSRTTKEDQRRRMMSVLTEQHLHKLVVWSSDQMIAPTSLSFIPPNVAKDDRIQRSILKYGFSMEKRQENKTKITLHSQLIMDFARYLNENGVKVQFGHFSNLIPDMHFYLGGSVYIVESEISDLQHPDRVLEKIRNYRNYNLIFITDGDRIVDLYDLVFKRRDIQSDGTINFGGSARAHISDLSGIFERIWIVSPDIRPIYYFSGKKYKFSLSILNESPFIKRLKKNKYGPAMIAIYNLMKSRSLYIMRKNEIISFLNFDTNFIKSIFGENGIISLYDIFLNTKLKFH
ncbi:type IV secretion system DNA-binding domain-containing protein [Thermoplasma sp.]|uniref:ATP-binding protein n=1 Tax=Thermoplasma sp. TaxID=1973142 RepID=UPI0026212659|nr:type IV secretion system DNA-binding domain-containing protein [Thermoplasma sp.]